MKRPNVIYAAPFYDENGNVIEGSVQKQLDYGKKFINTHIGKVNGTAIEKESEILKPITDRYVFNEIGMHYFLDDRINVVMDIELIRNIDTDVIESLVAKSDLYEIILLDKGKYVSHFGLSKPFVIKAFSYNGNNDYHETVESCKTFHRWDKNNHLKNMIESNYFRYCREIVFDNCEDCNVERFLALAQSQGSLQTILKLTPELIEKDYLTFQKAIYKIFDKGMDKVSFCYRMRIGVK